MLGFAGEVMPDVFKRRGVSAIRRFPKGCGRNAPPVDAKLLPGDASVDPSSHSPAPAGPEPGKHSAPETLIANGTVEAEVAKVLKQEPDELAALPESFEPESMDASEFGDQIEMADLQRRSMTNGTPDLGAAETLKPEPDELPGPSGSSQPETAYTPSTVVNHMEAADLLKTAVDLCAVKVEEEEVNDTDSVMKLEHLELSNESSTGLSNFTVLPKNGGFDAGISKLFGPSKRREVSAIRRYPSGCDRNAASVRRDEHQKASAAISKENDVYEESSGKQRLADARADKRKPLRKLEGKLGGSCDWLVGEDASRESQESVSETASDSRVMDESAGEKVPAQEACKYMQEVAQDGGKDVGVISQFLDVSNETTPKVSKKDKSVAPIGSETSCKGAQDIYRHDLIKRTRKVDSEQVTSEEHFVKQAFGRADVKQVEKKSQNKKAQENEIPSVDTQTQLELRKVVVKEATGSAGKIVKMKKGSDTKSQSWKHLEAKQEGSIQNAESRGKELSLDLHADITIVQALMAAPNCPWRRGKQTGMIQKSATDKSKTEVRVSKRKSVSSDTPSMVGHKAKKEVRTQKRKCLFFETSVHQPQNKPQDEEDFLLEDQEDEKALVVYHEKEDLPIETQALALYPERKELIINVPPFGPSDSKHGGGCNDNASIRIRVRRALRLFQVLCRKLLQGEESKKRIHGQRIRVDIAAANLLKDKNECVNYGKPIVGPVPGVEVGDEFHYRAELTVVGLHRSYQGGIDFTKIGGVNLAISIVASVGHADDMDTSDVLIYSGSGGTAAEGDKPAEDQKLERGNLALKNCIEAKTPVRVIRGIKELRCSDAQDGKSKPFSTFTYDGLYLVEDYWMEEGRQGFSVYKFKLRRIPGQPEIALKEVKKSKRSSVREGLCIADISEGKEKLPISVVNTIDDERPPHFVYVTKMIYPSWYTQTHPKGCDCTKRCSDSGKCACAVKNGGEIPFNFNGAIVQAKPLVYECGPSCKCPPSCHNRVSQHGIKIRLEIFKTQSRGWGVRSLASIPSGSFICEYIGELIQDKEAEQRSNDEYLFDIGHNYDDHDLWEGLPTLIPETRSHSEVVEEAGFTIDAAAYGNIGRFINHSCSPNLYAQNVLYDHNDKRMPHIMLFAAENIPPLQELTYHYNYTLGQVHDSEGNVKTKDCHCGSLECTGRLY